MPHLCVHSSWTQSITSSLQHACRHCWIQGTHRLEEREAKPAHTHDEGAPKSAQANQASMDADSTQTKPCSATMLARTNPVNSSKHLCRRSWQTKALPQTQPASKKCSHHGMQKFAGCRLLHCLRMGLSGGRDAAGLPSNIQGANWDASAALFILTKSSRRNIPDCICCACCCPAATAASKFC